MKKSRIKNAIATFVAAVLIAVPFLSVNTAAANVVYSASASYKSSSYYKSLASVKLTGDQVTDIVNIAKSQVGYHESSSTYDLSGYGSSSGNCTEYGRWYGMQSNWCNMFVSWCAYVAGVPTSIFPKIAGATASYQSILPSVGADCFRFSSGRAVEPGDLIFACTCSGTTSCIDHVGLVVGADSEHIYTVEGNLSDQVCAVTYPASTGYSSWKNERINYIARPQYEDNSATAADINKATAIKAYNGHIYAMYDISVSKSEAEKISASMGGSLVSITSEKENSFVSAFAAKGTYGRYYTGLSYNEKEDSYEWSNGDKYKYTNIDITPGEGFFSVAVDSDGVWSASSEKRRATGFICEIDASAVKPVNAAVFGGSKYEIYDTAMSYEEAAAFASLKGGKLTEITSDSENKLLSILLKDSDAYYINYSGTEKALISADYTNYKKSAEFSDNSENCAVLMSNGSAKWDVRGNYSLKGNIGFIVEYSAEETYTVTYDSNGGENTPIEQITEKAESLSVSTALPANGEKVFLGWSDNKKAKQADYLPGDTLSFTENTTLYAVWQ